MNGSSVPYLDVLDLIAFKVFCCGLRSQPLKRWQDGQDALALKRAADQRGLTFSETQKQSVKSGLSALTRLGITRDDEWKVILGEK